MQTMKQTESESPEWTVYPQSEPKEGTCKPGNRENTIFRAAETPQQKHAR